MQGIQKLSLSALNLHHSLACQCSALWNTQTDVYISLAVSLQRNLPSNNGPLRLQAGLYDKEP